MKLPLEIDVLWSGSVRDPLNGDTVERVIDNWKSSCDSAGGMGVAHNFYNSSDKTMKYINFVYVPYNSVGDIVACSVTGTVEAKCRLTGPIKPGCESFVRWEPLWYNKTIDRVKLKEVIIQYKTSDKLMTLCCYGLFGGLICICLWPVYGKIYAIRGLIIWLISICGFVVCGILNHIACYKAYLKKCERIKRKNQYEKENFEKNVKEYDNKKILYKREMEEWRDKCKEYETAKTEYDRLYIDYKVELDSYNSTCDKRKSVAEEKAEKLAEEIRYAGEKEYQDSIAQVQIAFPEKYNGHINEIIEIIQNMRADSIKEALAVLEDDLHKQRMLEEQIRLTEEQERLADEQRAYNDEQERYNQRMLREQERQAWAQEQHNQKMLEEQKRQNENLRRQAEEAARQAKNEQESRRREAREQCRSCGKRYSCPMHDNIDSVCPNYVKRKL